MKKGIGLKIFLSCFMTMLLITFLVFGISCSNKQATNSATTPATTSAGASTVQTGTTATFGNAAETTQAAGQGSALKEENAEVSALVEKITPSVVSIDVILNASSTNAQNAEGVGSGIIYKAEGFIITNNHVAGNANKITVTMNDGTNYDGSLVGADPNTDVAVVKITGANNLVPAVFVSEDLEKVGNFVLAVGSPFGVQQTITHGIISGLDRNVPMSANTLPFVDLIQTDAPINPGNSGGPLVNINGEVIGMNTLGLSTSGSNAGIGFSVPTDTIIAIADEIIKTGSPQLPYIGVSIGNNTSSLIGVLISSVTPGGPADKAGIKAGDILTDFNNEKLHNPYDLLGNIIQHQVGDTVTIKYDRGGTPGTASVVLEKRPANTSVTAG